MRVTWPEQKVSMKSNRLSSLKQIKVSLFCCCCFAAIKSQSIRTIIFAMNIHLRFIGSWIFISRPLHLVCMHCISECFVFLFLSPFSMAMTRRVLSNTLKKKFFFKEMFWNGIRFPSIHLLLGFFSFGSQVNCSLSHLTWFRGQFEQNLVRNAATESSDRRMLMLFCQACM